MTDKIKLWTVITEVKALIPSSQIFVNLDTSFQSKFLEQLCPAEVAYWVKNYVAILTRAAHWMTYFDLSKLHLVETNVLKAFVS